MTTAVQTAEIATGPGVTGPEQSQERRRAPLLALRALGASRVGRAVWALDLALMVGALVLFLGPVRTLEPFSSPVLLPWPVMVLAFTAAEWWRVHLHFRRSSHSLSLSEIPLVTGLFLLSPAGLVMARAVGTLVGLGLLRRQAPIKLCFNLGLFSLEAAVAGILAHALVPVDAPVGIRAWLGVAVVVTAVSILGSAAVMLVISLAEGPPTLGHVLQNVALGLAGGVANASLSLEGLAMLRRDPAELCLLAVPLVALAFAYAAYTTERQRRQRMQDLYRSKDLLEPASGLRAGAPALLTQLCTVFRAEMAQVVALPDDGDHDVAVITVHNGVCTEETRPLSLELLEELLTVSAPEPRSVLISASRPTETRTQSLAGHKDAMLTPLRVESQVLGLLIVADRLGDLNTFSNEDVQFFEALAAHASVSLQNWRLDDRLKHQAFHDPLTGLGNRTLFTTRLAHALDRRDRDISTVAVLFVDLDDFKMVNDSLGHEAGDAVLTRVAERVQSVLRPFDTAARLGGDEFAVLLEDTAGPDAAAETAERIIAALARPFTLQGSEVAMHASIGVAMATAGVEGVELLRQADVAMYRAKDRGKARFELYDSTMQRAVERRLELKTDLERALPRSELLLHYQPIVTLTTGELVGAEALVRWRHPERGMVPPDQFIALAEETGLIMQIGRFVLEEACRQAARWRELHPDRELTMSVNLSPRQLQQPGFSDEVARVLHETGMTPASLTLEITESFMVDSSPSTQERLRELKALGVRLSIDDFGTGYSSLAALHTLPVDSLKIAKPFVDVIADDLRMRALVKAIAVLGRTLDLDLIAEGVERPEQRDQLIALRCDKAQGYFYSRPLDSDAFLALMERTTQRSRRHDLDPDRGAKIISLPA